MRRVEPFERAKSVWFAYVTRRADVSDRYFDYCSRKSLPFVRIWPRGSTWADDVSVDMIPVGKVLSHDAIEKAVDAVESCADRRARLKAGRMVVGADWIRREHWEPLARKLFEIATAPNAQISEEDWDKEEAERNKPKPDVPR